MNRKIRRRVFHTFEREFAIPAVQTTVDVGDGLTIADNAAGLMLFAGVGLHDSSLALLIVRNNWSKELYSLVRPDFGRKPCLIFFQRAAAPSIWLNSAAPCPRSEERRVGKECRLR